MQTWELLTALASDCGLPVRLYLPQTPDQASAVIGERLRDDYQLDPAKVEIVGFPCAAREPRAEIMKKRDRLVVDEADLLLPISIRKSGSMTELLGRAEQNGGQTDWRFRVEPTFRSRPLKLEVDKRWLRPDSELYENRYLVHWTRGISHPWPDERSIDFYRAVIASETWPRSGLATIERILRSGTILASDRHMPDKARTVSFSGLAPIDFLPLMRWRARYAEMSFEPYGVGVKAAIAGRVGIRQVRYLRHRSGPSAERWLTQSAGRVTPWQCEQEYRFLGDLHLDRIPPDDVCLFCRTEKEAAGLRRDYPYAVRPLFDHPA